MIHNYLIIYINFAGLLLSKKRMKGKNSKGLIQKTGYMQEKDQKESIPQTCLIQVHVNSQCCLISCILRKVIEIYFLGLREWSLWSKTID